MKVLRAAILAASIFLGCLAYVPHAMAQPNVALVSCSSVCIANSQWGGTVDGASSTIVTDVATNGSDFNDFVNFVRIDTSTHAHVMDVGYEYKVCGSGLDYFYKVYNTSGGVNKSGCLGVPVGDLGGDTFFGATHYVSGGGGWNIWINGNLSGQTICNPCGVAYNGFTSGFYIINETDISTNLTSWSGDILGDRDFHFNQWHNGAGWHYQTVNPGTGVTDPPQLQWNPEPQNDSFGGVMYTCAYDSGGTCP